jgi:hypothetical protein
MKPKDAQVLKPLQPFSVADQVTAGAYFGRVTAFAHVAGYTFERALAELEWLLEDDRRWRSFGHENINEFIDSIKFDKELRLAAEQRQRIAKRIKELQPEASNRKIAKALGTSHQTVGRDLVQDGPTEAEITKWT